MKLIVNILKVIGLIFLSLICNIIPMMLLQSQSKFSLGVKWILGLLYLILIALVMITLWKYYKKHENISTENQKMTWKDFGIALLFWLAMRVVAIVGTLVNQWYTGQSTTTNDAALQSLTQFFSNGFFLYIFLYVVLVGMVGPIIEEMAYRAFPQYLLFKNHGKILAGVVTSLVFSLPHSTNLIEFLTYAGIGALLYLAYQRRGNIKDSMLLHILNNLPLAIMLLLMGLNGL